jgi:hypothetical protein
MARPRKAQVTKKRTVHMYSELWHASACVLEAACREPRGAAWQYLSSVVLTAFTFEAYLNHAGEHAIACWGDIERLPPLGKFNLLCEILKVDFPKEKTTRPLQTISELIEFRNTMAHGRTGEVEARPAKRDINNLLDRQLGDRPLQDWERRIKTAAFAKRAREDVKVVLEQLHAARPEPKEALFSFGMGSHSATPLGVGSGYV